MDTHSLQGRALSPKHPDLGWVLHPTGTKAPHRLTIPNVTQVHRSINMAVWN